MYLDVVDLGLKTKKIKKVKQATQDIQAGLDDPHTFTRHEDRVVANLLQIAPGALAVGLGGGEFACEALNVEGVAATIMVTCPVGWQPTPCTARVAFRLAGLAEGDAVAKVGGFHTALEELKGAFQEKTPVKDALVALDGFGNKPVAMSLHQVYAALTELDIAVDAEWPHEPWFS